MWERLQARFWHPPIAAEAAPTEDWASPPTIGLLPQTIGLLPQTIGLLPQTIGLLPQTIGLLPQTIGFAAFSKDRENPPHRVDQARVRYRFARALLDRNASGDRARAMQMLAAARDLSESMALHGLTTWIDAQLAR